MGECRKMLCATLFVLAFTTIFTYLLVSFIIPPWWDGKVIFEDEFNGLDLDFMQWAYAADINNTDDENVVYYSNSLSNNVQIQGGSLKLSTIDSPPPRPGYILRSAQIHQKTSGFHRGSFVIRARFPHNKFLASTIRLVSSDHCLHNQITIVRRAADTLSKRKESTSLVFGASIDLSNSHHLSENYSNHNLKISKNVDFDLNKFYLNTEFHEYGITWTKNSIRWYFYRSMMYEMTLDPEDWRLKVGEQEISCVRKSLFSQPMQLVVDLDAYPGFEKSYSYFYGDDDIFEIDWIRVYEEIDYDAKNDTL